MPFQPAGQFELEQDQLDDRRRPVRLADEFVDPDGDGAEQVGNRAPVGLARIVRIPTAGVLPGIGVDGGTDRAAVERTDLFENVRGRLDQRRPLADQA